MRNNSTNGKFEELTFPSLLEKYDKILIPMLQRDYAQGRTDKKAQEVRSNLLNDIFDRKKENVHFDLIFGSCEKRNENDGEKLCFIPVDGQQRLTTLFLLYLYAQKTGQHIEGVDLSKFSYDTRRAAADFCKEVTAKQWNVKSNEQVSDTIKDSVWFMNYWENDPTVAGMLNMLDAINQKAKGEPINSLEKIKFYFFDLKSSGLNENLYLKMNSRGKPLTAFENLKASIEKILPDDIDSNDTKKYFPENIAAPETFKDKWKFFMDRDWINAFWNSEKPEETDINITAFIVRFLSGYYNAFNEDNNENNISEELKEINNKENYADFIPFEPIEKILKLKKTFQTLAYALTIIPSISQYWSEDPIKIAEKSEYKFLAVIFSYVLFDGDESAMRFAWNMAENTVSGYDNFIAYCKRMKEISDIYKKERNIYKVLVDSKFDNTSEQLKEEIAKAKQILIGEQRSDGKAWEEIIIEAEKYAFFKGAIRFLFTDRYENPNWCIFDTKWQNAKEYFDEGGVKDDKKVFLTKSLVIQCDNWIEQLYDKQIFNPNANTWKWVLTAKNWIIPVHNILMANNINDIGATNENNDEKVKEFITPIIKDLPFDYFINNEPNGRFRWLGPRLCFYKPYGRDMATLDWENWHRNEILSSLLESINTEAQMGDSNLFWGWNIKFSYKNNYFQWYGNPNEKELDVYLMENNWADYKKRPNPTSDKGTDEDIYYCFRVTKDMENDTSQFMNALNKLIEQL